MHLFLTILILIASIFMILIVLVQKSKGGGLSSGFSASNQIMGVRKTTDFLEKATWTLAGVIIVLSIIAAAFLPSSHVTERSEIKDNVQQSLPVTTPGFENQSVPEQMPEMPNPETGAEE